MNTLKDPYGILTIVGAKELLEEQEEIKKIEFYLILKIISFLALHTCIKRSR